MLAILVYYSRTCLDVYHRAVKMYTPYPKFVLIGAIYIEKALEWTEIVFVLTGVSY